MGTGYVRQSIPDIVTGEDITAAPLNAEFNAIQAAFSGTTGHSHDGTTGEGPTISLTTSISGTLPVDNGGTGATTLTDGGILLGSGTGAITATAALADGEMLVGDGTTDPAIESGATLRASIGVPSTAEAVLVANNLSDVTATTARTNLDVPSNAEAALVANNLSDVTASTARTNLNVDVAGTDNSTDVTLTGTGTYLSLAGQAITVDPITESDISDLQSYLTSFDVVDDTTPQLGGDLDMNGNSVTDLFTVTDTAGSATSGPTIDLFRNSGTPASLDNIGVINYTGNKDGGATVTYAEIQGIINDNNSVNYDGAIMVKVASNGVMTDIIEFDPNQIFVKVPLYPEADDTLGLGSTTRRWSDGYIAGEFNVGNVDVASTTTTGVLADGISTSSTLTVQVPAATSDGQNPFRVYRGTTVVTAIKGDGDLQNVNNNYGAISDARLKTNIVVANSQWNDISALTVVNYDLIKAENADGNIVALPTPKAHIGLIAQDVEKVSAGLVSTSEDGDKVKSIKYSVLNVKMLGALQEAMQRIEILEQKLVGDK